MDEKLGDDIVPSRFSIGGFSQFSFGSFDLSDKDEDHTNSLSDRHHDDSNLSKPYDTTSKGEDEYPGGWRLAAIMTSLCLGTLLVAIDNTIIGIAIPQISTVFDALADVGWYGSAYLLTVTALQPTFGNVYKYFDVKITYLVSILVFEGNDKNLQSRYFFFPSPFRFLVLRRSYSWLNPLCRCSRFPYLHRRPSGRRRWFRGHFPRRIGHRGIHYTPGEKTTVSRYSGQLVRNRYLLRSYSGRCPNSGSDVEVVLLDVGCFKFSVSCYLKLDGQIRNLPIGGLVLIILLVALKINTANTESRSLPFKTKMMNMDFIGAALLVGAVCCLLLALQWGGNTMPWNSATVIGLFVGFGIISVIFAVLQWFLGDKGTISPRILRKRSVLMGCLFEFFLSMTLYIVRALSLLPLLS